MNLNNPYQNINNMKLEQQVPSLELCKRLKELGYPQIGLFWWDQMYTRKSGEYKKDSKEFLVFKKTGIGGECVAPTVSELIKDLQSVAKCDIIIANKDVDVANTLALKLIKHYEKSKI